jgi:cell division protein FtsB
MNDKTREALTKIAQEHRAGLIAQIQQVNQKLVQLREESAKLEAQAKRLNADLEKVTRALANTLLP